MWQEELNRHGFAMVQERLNENETSSLLHWIGTALQQRTKAGIRHALEIQAVDELARDPRMMAIAREVLGGDTIPFRATFFDKSPDANWLVVWHQDTALPLREKREGVGWGPWSVKQGVIYAHAPANALQKVLALRIHFDHSTLENGPLRVLSGTHKLGILSNNSLQETATRTPATDCLVSKGGILAMRPLIVHSSSKSRTKTARRVLHIEYASSIEITEGMELARV